MTTRRRRGTAAAFCWALLLWLPAAHAEDAASRPQAPRTRASTVTIDVPDGCAASIRAACPDAFKGVRELRTCFRGRPSGVSASCRAIVEKRLSAAEHDAPANPKRVAAKPARRARPAVGTPAPRSAAPKAAALRKPSNDKQARAAVVGACKSDAQEFCSDLTKPDEADTVGCLKAYANQASAPCASALDDLAKFEGD